jgi:serine/threonine protein kinase
MLELLLLFIFTTALLLLYYCFTTSLLLLYYFCTASLLQDFVRKLVCLKTDERYTAAQALNHPWITRLLAEGLASAGLMYIYIYRFMWTHMYTYTQSPPDNASFG